MPTVALRPRSTTEILDAAVQLLRRYFPPLFTLGVIAMLPMVAIGVASALVADPATTVAGQFPPGLIPVFLVGIPLGGVWFVVADAALIVAASEAYLDHRVTVAGALRRAASRAGSVIGAVLLKLLIIFGTFMAGSLVVGIASGILAVAAGRGSAASVVLIAAFVAGLFALGVYVYALFFAVPATVVLENRSAGSAVARARELARGETGKIIKVFVLVFVLLAFVSVAIVAASVLLARFAAVAQLLAMVPYALTYAVLDAVTAILYYDIRARKEGFDLELMAQELAAEPAPRSAY